MTTSMSVDEAIGAALAILWCGFGDVAQLLVGNEAGECLAHHRAVAPSGGIVGNRIDGDVAIDKNGGGVAIGVGVGGATV